MERCCAAFGTCVPLCSDSRLVCSVFARLLSLCSGPGSVLSALHVSLLNPPGVPLKGQGDGGPACGHHSLPAARAALLLSLLLLRLCLLRVGSLGGHWCGGRGVGAYGPHLLPECSFLLCLVPPELIGDLDPLINVTAALHSPLTLLCEATGIPPPEVRWFRGEEPISPGDNTYLLAGKVLLRGESGSQVWPSLSVHHTPMTSDPELPSLIGITVSAIGPPRVHPKTPVR